MGGDGDGDGAEWRLAEASGGRRRQRHGQWEMAGGSTRALEMVFFCLAFEFSISSLVLIPTKNSILQF